MAKNNGTGSSAASQSGGLRQGKRSSTRGNARGTSARRSSGSRKSSSRSSGSREPTMLEAMSPLGRGYAVGRRRGRTAVQSIKSAGTRAVETVGEHPIPVALISAGLAWLLLENRGLRPTDARIIERSRDAIGELGETIAETAGTAGRSIANAVGGATEGVVEGASYVGEYVANAASTVGRAAANTRQTLDNLWERHPMAMSAAIVTAGVAVGMLLPASAREGELLGRPASNIVKRARRKGSQMLDEGRRIAATGVKAVRREGERQGLTAGEIVHKVKRVVRSGREAITE